MAGGELDEQRLDAVERLDRGRRVVDRGRQRADGDVDEHADRERRVLVDRPLAREHEHAPRQRGVGRGLAVADPEHHLARAEVLADHRDDLHEAAGLLGEAQQRGAVDRGDHGRRTGVRDLRRIGVCAGAAATSSTGSLARVDVLDHGVAAPQQRAQDAADLRALERALDERDEGAERDERQRQPEQDGGGGHEVATRPWSSRGRSWRARRASSWRSRSAARGRRSSPGRGGVARRAAGSRTTSGSARRRTPPRTRCR